MMQTHRFVEPRSYDTPLADLPDWDEIDKLADRVRQTPVRTPYRKENAR